MTTEGEGTHCKPQDNSAVCYCSDVSKNKFDIDSMIGQTFEHAIDTNGGVKTNGHNTVHAN